MKASKPERAVRAALLRLGVRFERNPNLRHARHPRRRYGDLREGRYWHGHGCRPASANAEKNRKRDVSATAYWRDRGRHMVVWECETRNFDQLGKRLAGFLAAR